MVFNTNRYIEYLYNNGNDQYDEYGYFFDPEAVTKNGYDLMPATTLSCANMRLY